MLSPIKHHAQRALALNPDSPWGHVALANYYSYLGEWALERSEAALADKLAANSAEILHATSGLHWEVGERDQTTRNLERASKLDPLSADIALSLGVHLFAARRHAKAESLLNRVIILAPDRPETYMYKAWLYLSWHGDLSEARAVLQSAVQKLGPERAFVAGFLRSEWWASRILASDPWYRTTLMGVTLGAPDLDSVQYYMHKAGLLQGLGRDPDARPYWDSVVPIIEGRIGTLPRESRGWATAQLHMNLALALVGLGRKEPALREARRADELDNPTGWPGALAMALTLAAAGEHAAATAQFKRVMSMDNWVTPKFLSLDPALKPLRQTPEYQRLLAHH
jgi:tetratricopeptide (TPR) repeat protein